MKEDLGLEGSTDGRGEASTDGITAVVLTHMRPGLAGDVTRSLIEDEGFPPQQVVVVVNGVGGLDDPMLESQVRMVRLRENTGPAGGFRAGLVEAFRDPSIRWAYLCEDDVGLFTLPTPRVADVVDRIESLEERTSRVGAVVAYGRRFVGRGAHTVNFVPDPEPPHELAPVDVACWGATLVSRRALDAGVLPDPEWFFGLEDFDFFCRLRESGLEVLVDGIAARRVARQQTSRGREEAHQERRPTDAVEAWRAYYHARNSFALMRRHGRPSWYAWHLAYTARHLQKARDGTERRAILHGFWDGARGRMGEHPGYRRQVGEYDPGPGASDGGPASGAR